jgi:hypothetical protein
MKFLKKDQFHLLALQPKDDPYISTFQKERGN